MDGGAANGGAPDATGETPSLESVRELRLMALLHDLVKRVGRVKAAEELGVDRKTLWRSMNSGRLVPRLASALERRLLADQRSEVVRQGERLSALEQRTGALEETVRSGLDAVRGDLADLREAQAQTLRQWERRLATLPPVDPDTRPAVGGEPAGTPPRRTYPDIVTLEPEPGEELVYCEAMPLIVEWRRVRVEHIDQGRSRLARATAWVRMRELELVLIREHALTLLPAYYPWDRLERDKEMWRREQSLADARAERRWALFWRCVRRVLTLGLWRK